MPVYEVELEFDWEGETKISVKEVMHCHLHYKSLRPERYERSKSAMFKLAKLINLTRLKLVLDSE